MKLFVFCATKMEHLLRLRKQVLTAILATDAAKAALAGTLDPRLYARYLINVWHYAQHSTTVIAVAGARCAAEHPQLAGYLLRHAQEELSHEQWALDDLRALDVDKTQVFDSRPVPACTAMIAYEHYLAYHSNPVALFGWMYVLEAMGADLGHKFSQAVTNTLGNTSAVKFIQGHGDADKDHTVDLSEQIRLHIKGTDLADVNYAAETTAELYPRIFKEISDGPLPVLGLALKQETG